MINNSRPISSAIRPFVVVHDCITVRDMSAVSFARTACGNPDVILAQHAANHHRAARDGYVIAADVSADGFSGAQIESVGIMTLLDQHFAETVTFSRVYVKDRDRLRRYGHPGARAWIEYEFLGRDVEIVYQRSAYSLGFSPWGVSTSDTWESAAHGSACRPATTLGDGTVATLNAVV